MKTVYLIRHAKSSWKHPELIDHDRPLNKRGKRDAPEMGRRLRDQQINPDVIISSTANRAFITAQVIAKQIGFESIQIIPDSELYHADPNTILSIIQSVEETAQSAILFGHNPGFTWTANQLANIQIDNIPTCGVVVIGFSVDNWAEVAFGNGELVFYDYPKKES